MKGKKLKNRFSEFSPPEKEVLRILLQNHLNSVSEIAVRVDARVGQYLMILEELESEINQSK